MLYFFPRPTVDGVTGQGQSQANLNFSFMTLLIFEDFVFGNYEEPA